MNMKYLGISQLERLKKPKNLNSHNLDDLHGEEKKWHKGFVMYAMRRLQQRIRTQQWIN